MRCKAPRRASGASLIELVIVIVAATIGTVALGSAYLASARSIAMNDDIQIAWQVANACADHLLGRVRRPGAFANVPTSVSPTDPCALLPANSSTRNITVSTFAGGTEPCVGAWSCRLVNVSVTRGGYTASVNFVFMDN